MEVWQLLLLKGNDSFNKLELPLAEEYYHQAIDKIHDCKSIRISPPRQYPRKALVAAGYEAQKYRQSHI